MSLAEPRHRNIARYPISEFRARRKVLQEYETFDPEVDYKKINQYLVGRIFGDPLFFDAIFIMSYWRQTAIRTIAPVLHMGGQSYDTEKRVDDTLLFFGYIYRDGPDTEEGGQTIDRLAAIHQGFPIPPDDYRYTCASLCFEPGRVAAAIGAPLTAGEERASYLFWSEVGRRWGMDIPENQEEFRAWWEQYERDSYELTEHGPAITVAMGDDFCRRFFPGPMKKLGYLVLRSIGSDEMCDAVGQPRVSPRTRKAIGKGLALYVRARRFLPASSTDRFLGPWSGLYGREPEVTDVGPTWSMGLTHESRTRKTAATCPFG